MPTMHETAAKRLLDRWMDTPDGSRSLGEVYKGMERGWDRDYAGVLGQKTTYGAWPMEQVSCAGLLHARVVSGEIGIARVRAAGTPSMDRLREDNASKVADLPCPFSATVYATQGYGDPDGELEWARPVTADVVTNPDALAPGASGDVKANMRMKVKPGKLPLEIGSTQPSRTLLHAGEDKGVARWPYGSDWIWVLLDMRHFAVEQPYTPAINTYKPTWGRD